MNRKELFTGEKRVITYSPDLAIMLDSVPTAIMLSQLVHWSGHERKVGWIGKSQHEFFYETGLTRNQQETARRILINCGFIKVKRRGCPPTTHYHLELEVIGVAWQRFMAEREKHTAAVREEAKQNTYIPERQVPVRAALKHHDDVRNSRNRTVETATIEEEENNHSDDDLLLDNFRLSHFSSADFSPAPIYREDNTEYDRDDGIEYDEDNFVEDDERSPMDDDDETTPTSVTARVEMPISDVKTRTPKLRTIQVPRQTMRVGPRRR